MTLPPALSDKNMLALAREALTKIDTLAGQIIARAQDQFVDRTTTSMAREIQELCRHSPVRVAQERKPVAWRADMGFGWDPHTRGYAGFVPTLFAFQPTECDAVRNIVPLYDD